MSETKSDDVPPEASRPAEEGLADLDPDDAFDATDAEPNRGDGRFLTDLADVLRQAGLEVNEYAGWQQRSRSGGGYAGAPAGIIVHHTASGQGSDGQNDASYMTERCEVAPMANLYLERSGRWWVLAAGATNTNGKGGPWGRIPANSANSRVIGIEAGNNGIGEAWPEGMQESYTTGVAALAKHYRIDTANVLAHHEWAPSRKVDPAGPSRFGSINHSGSWNMDAFRNEVNAKRGSSRTIATPERVQSTAAVYVVQPGDAWWAIAARTLGNPAQTWGALADANGGRDRVLHPGDVLVLPGAAGGGAAPGPAAGVPTYPGEAKEGDRGPHVLAWQEALIAHGVIGNSQENRDSFYGQGMAKAVLRLQQSWGWDDADGVAGEHSWRKLHGGT